MSSAPSAPSAPAPATTNNKKDKDKDDNDNARLYQVEFKVEDVGKRLGASKKRVTWIFGHDGKEYTVTFVWSKRSGKRMVYMAGSNVYFDQKTSGVFFYKFTSAEGLNLHILATSATPAKDKVGPHFLKYELVIEGQRFSELAHKDGSPAVIPDSSQYPGPASIFEILYPNGYHETLGGTKGEAAFSSKRKLQKEVTARIVKQATYNATHANKKEETATATANANATTEAAGTSTNA